MISTIVPLVWSKEERSEKCIQLLESVKKVAASQRVSCLQVLEQSLYVLAEVVF